MTLYGVFYAPEDSLHFDLLYVVADRKIAKDAIAATSEPSNYKIEELRPVDKVPIIHECYYDQDGFTRQSSYLRFGPAKEEPFINKGVNVWDGTRHVTVRTTTNPETALRIAKESLEEDEN